MLHEFDRELKKFACNEIDIMKWKDDWVNKAGLNSIIFTKDPVLDKGYIEQKACLEAYPTLRQHFIKIGFYSEKG